MNILFLLPFFFFSYEIIYKYVPREYSWYFMHLIVNFIAVLVVYEDIWTVFTIQDKIENIEPSGGLLKVENPIIFLDCLITSLHLFHMKYALRKDDYVHHTFMTLALNLCVLYFKPIFATCLIFFMNGLPGGIDYFLLILVKKGKIKSIEEKRINTYLNNYLRAPGILILIGFIIPVLDVNFASAFCIFSSFFNAVYYAREVGINYGIKSITQ